MPAERAGLFVYAEAEKVHANHKLRSFTLLEPNWRFPRLELRCYLDASIAAELGFASNGKLAYAFRD